MVNGYGSSGVFKPECCGSFGHGCWTLFSSSIGCRCVKKQCPAQRGHFAALGSPTEAMPVPWENQAGKMREPRGSAVACSHHLSKPRGGLHQGPLLCRINFFLYFSETNQFEVYCNSCNPRRKLASVVVFSFAPIPIFLVRKIRWSWKGFMLKCSQAITSNQTSRS